MGHLRLVHSAPSAPAPAHPSLEAYSGELDYICQTLRWLGASAENVDELAHEVFLTLHRTWPQDGDGSTPSRLRPHIFGLAVRVVRGIPGREGPDPPKRAQAGTEPSSDGGASKVSPHQERLALLQEALDGVPLLRRAVLVLHDIDGVPLADIATALSLSRTGTRWRLRSGRRDLAATVRHLARLGRAGATQDAPRLEMGALLADGKSIPRQTEVIRARALLRARAAVTMGATGFELGAPARGRRGGVYLVMAACLAFAVGAVGAAVLLRGETSAEATAAYVP